MLEDPAGQGEHIRSEVSVGWVLSTSPPEHIGERSMQAVCKKRIMEWTRKGLDKKYGLELNCASSNCDIIQHFIVLIFDFISVSLKSFFLRVRLIIIIIKPYGGTAYRAHMTLICGIERTVGTNSVSCGSISNALILASPESIDQF